MLWENFIKQYGYPEKFVSDQGRKFESELISELCKLAQVEKVHATPYFPMTSGQCERFNSTLYNMLGTLPEKDKADWKVHLSSMTHVYSWTQHPSTIYSPYCLMFGRQPRLPTDFELGFPVDDLGDNCSKTRYVHKLKLKLNFAYKKLGRFPKKKPKSIDDLVLVKRVAWKGRHKSQNQWEPEEYVVLEKTNKIIEVYKVKPVGNGKERVHHRDLLLPLSIKFIPEVDSDI